MALQGGAAGEDGAQGQRRQQAGRPDFAMTNDFGIYRVSNAAIQQPGKTLKNEDTSVEDRKPRSFSLQITRKIGS